MSTISKILKLFNVNSLLAPKIHRISELTATQRFYSKRFTYYNKCTKDGLPITKEKTTKGKNKEGTKSTKSKTAKKCKTEQNAYKEVRTKSEAKSKCKPFKQKESEKCSTEKHKPRKCTPGMRHPCDETPCPPQCTLTTGQKRISLQECPNKDVLPHCPKGDWEM